jgi:hypothetical protein
VYLREQALLRRQLATLTTVPLEATVTITTLLPQLQVKMVLEALDLLELETRVFLVLQVQLVTRVTLTL